MKKRIIMLLVVVSCITVPSYAKGKRKSLMDRMMDKSTEMAGSMQDSMDEKYGVENANMALDLVDDTYLQRVYEVKSTIENSKDKIIEWISQNFVDSNDEVLINEVNKISGTGSLLVTIKMGFSQNMKPTFNYDFEIKENRIRITLKNAYVYKVMVNEYGNSVGGTQQYFLNALELQHVSKSLKEKNIITELIKFIEGDSSSSDW